MKYTLYTVVFLAIVALVAVPLHVYKLKRPWKLFDLTFFGVAFIFSAFGELANIISTNWQYHPKFFGIQTSGAVAVGILIAQPLLHVAIGYGFLTLRRWAFYLALFYIADTLTSSITSFILQGFGRIRTIFIALLTPFFIYIVARRRLFVK